MNVATIQGSDELKDLYRELILDHSRSPRNFGKLADATHVAEGINPLCGDKLRLYLRLDGQRVAAARFEGSGCAIAVASASLLTETVMGKSSETSLAYGQEVIMRLTGKSPGHFGTATLQKLQALDGVREFPARVKCATLAWQALGAAINGQAVAATTE